MKHEPIPGLLESNGVAIRSTWGRKPLMVARAANPIFTREANIGTAQRIVECWNACAGIAEPLAALAAARTAIASASSVLLEELDGDPEASLLRAALVDLNAAAALFGMQPETLPADPDEEEEDA